MDSKEQEFLLNLMATFRVEAAEHLQALSDGFMELEKGQPPEEHQKLIETIFREAHSLKGAARAVNQLCILDICQELETVLSLYNQKKITISSAGFDALHETLKTIQKALIEPLSPSIITYTLAQLNAISEQSLSATSKKKTPEPLSESAESSPPLISSQQKPLGSTIRISSEKINTFFQEAEEVLIIKLLYKTKLKQMGEIHLNMYQQEKQFGRMLDTFQVFFCNAPDSQLIGSRLESANHIVKFLDDHFQKMRSIRGDINRLLKNTEQQAQMIGATVDKLLEDLRKILMQPMSILFDTLPHMIRDISRQLSKEIRVEFKGDSIEIDRRVLDEIKDPVIHIIRNAIDHGIESPQERIKNSKPTVGSIRITAAESEGNKIVLSISDDGRGIDLLKLKEVAFEKGVISQKELKTISDDEAIKLAFHSDISTSSIITDLSGRGFGLGVVSEKVDKLGGEVNVVSALNQGTTFTLTLPLTLATFRGIRISVADQDFILPTHYVRRVMRIRSNAIQHAENCKTIVVEDNTYSFIHLANLLGIKKLKKIPESGELLYVLIIKAADQMIAFGADSIYNEQEILVKSLGKQPIRVKNILAATISETGSVIPILNPVDLIKSAIKGDTVSSAWKIQEDAISKKSILLVEDSITTRLLFKNVLVSEGYEVKAAVDGVEALEILQSQTFDLLITDVEMPRMNGFELTEKVRAMPRMNEVPIIICTALGSREDRERGIELGANAYLDKNKFEQKVFIDIVKNLV